MDTTERGTAMRRVAILLMAAGLAAPATARAAGGPAYPVQGGAGVGVPGSAARYVAVGIPGGTLVERLVHGRVGSTKAIPGSYGVPAASVFDGSTTGLSGDQRTLVLAEIPRRYPPKTTRLAVLQLHRFVVRVRERVTLPGSFTVDAISPDGRRVYLIHYTHPNDVLRYEVRAYDLAHHRLLPKPIVDPREPDEKMQGTPVTRAMSADSRWAYTLYGRPEGAPFIHALDTRAGTAACIDLDGLDSADATGYKLVVPRGGGPLAVAGSAGPVKLVDRTTFKVSDPPAPAAPSPAPTATHAAARRDAAGSGPPWGFAAVLIAGLGVVAVAARRARSRSAA
jgi:hypothetical protein